jgi:hypothetical protein
MNFTSLSRRWTINECSARPEDVIRSLISAVVRHLPENSLGHVKGYVEFKHGAVFASSTLIPPEVILQKTGDYQGGSMWVNVTMIFFDLSREVLAAALEMAGGKLVQRWDCKLTDAAGGIHGD